MPELPEIASSALEMNTSLRCKTILMDEIKQPKSLNLPADVFTNAVTGARIMDVTYHGKWIKVRLDKGWLLINQGMGGELLLTTHKTIPEKYRLVFDFTDDTCLVVNFWWFGYVYFAPVEGLAEISMLAKLGPNIIDLSLEEFSSIVRAQSPKAKVKVFMLDQARVAGVGNAYIHDILFLAGLHPLRLLATLTDKEMASLHSAILDSLLPSMKKGGAFYETNLFGEKGGFLMEDILIGYREGEPCPKCGTVIEKIRTGSTMSFICPACQPIN